MNLDGVRESFPLANRRVTLPVSGMECGLVYLDHAASTPPPRAVLDEVNRFLSEDYANVHRGQHLLSRISSDAFEGARDTLARFLKADLDHQGILFTTNTTGALNMAAHLVAGEEGIVLTTEMEHHSNDLPYRARGPVVHVDVHDDGSLDMDDYARKLSEHRVKLVAVSGASNVTGHMPDVHAMARLAHDHGARILVDAAQRYAHAPLDVRPAGHPEHLDFVAAAGHKAYAPFGSAFLLAPRDLADKAPPYLPGGGTVLYVTRDGAEWNGSPSRHEGGTPNVTGAIAFAAATRFLERVGMAAIREHERVLTRRILDGLRALPGVQVLGGGGADERIGVVSFTIEGMPHGLVSAALDAEHAVATRNGCFCAHPYLYRLLGLKDGAAAAMRDRILQAGTTKLDDLPGAARASLGAFNDEADVDRLLEGVRALAEGKMQGSYRFDAEAGWAIEATPPPRPLRHRA